MTPPSPHSTLPRCTEGLARTMRLTTPSSPQPRRVPHPTQLTTRTNRPIPRTVRHTTQELKVYTFNPREDENSKLNLPPTTTALVIKKEVK